MQTNNKIQDLYKNLTYFDQYSTSVLKLILIIIILILICSYCYVMTHIKPLQQNWPTERCKVAIMPFAGIINAPAGQSINDYTTENFNFCIQNINSAIAGFALEPLTFIVNMFKELFKDISDAINSIRAMFDNIRAEFENVSKEIMGRIMNIMIPLQHVIITMKDFLSKIQGTMTAGLFTLFGSYMTLASLFGAIAEFIIIILIALVVVIIILWIVPFTWGAAASMTAVFLGLSIPMAIILTFMIEYLHVKPDISIPTVKCFDKNTIIKLNNGKCKKIKDVQIGDILSENNVVTEIIKVSSKNSIMYKLKNIIVSDSHKIKLNNKWINVSDHPDARLITEKYKSEYLYCLNTVQKKIVIDKYTFSDWDEILNENFNNLNLIKHGLSGFNKVKLKNGKLKKLMDVIIGDELSGNSRVYGLVKIDGKNISQYKFNINGTSLFGTKNLCLSAPNQFVDNLENSLLTSIQEQSILYHLLTTNSTFNIDDVIINDYNYLVDKHLSIS